MTPETLFYILIAILLLNFAFDKWLDSLNAKRFGAPVPEALQDVYNPEEYAKAQAYKKANYRFATLSSTCMFIGTLLFFFLDGFAFVDTWARSFSENPVVVALLFFAVLGFAADLLSTPFSYYHTFVIEEKFGFNKMTKKTFVLDKVKGWLLGAVLGGGILALLVWFYESVGQYFWLWAWVFITVFSVVLNLFYAKLIVPVFNKQSPLEHGSLRDKIESYAKKVQFTLENIFVIDGSKRSTKANAYFSGFGKEKRITLFDTLIHDLEEEEVVAVLAHEVGHYKKKHLVVTLIISTITTGITLWILGFLVGNPLLSEALGIAEPSFHIGLIAFAILYTPISAITGLLMNYLSRKFEYQADTYAKATYGAQPLLRALKKLSKNNLSNLTPHPAYVFVHYSHPTLLQRYKNLKA